jgi:hypothetical protein
MIKEIANVIIRNEYTDLTDISLYSSRSADGYSIYILKDESVGRIVEEENIFIKKDDIIDVLVGDYIAGYSSMLEVYVSNDLIKEVIDELEFLLLPEEEYENEDRKYDEYKDDKLTI